MSKKTDFINETRKAGRAAGGSRKTLHDRHNKLAAFCSWAWHVGYQLVSVESIRTRHIVEYIAARLADGVSPRTVHNDMSAIRSALRGAKCAAFANSTEISNPQLGIGGASRKGTKRPISDQEFQEVYQRALVIDPGLAAVLGLQRWAGLRGREAVMAIKSLADWCQFLTVRTTDTIRVIHGTKGGRVRNVTLHRRDEAITAIEFAYTVAKARNGMLIEAPDLKKALAYFHRHAHDVLGLRGEIAPHSLRYAYAIDAVEAYKRAGYSEREAQAMAAVDLGHGSGRGRLVREIYGRRPKPDDSAS